MAISKQFVLAGESTFTIEVPTEYQQDGKTHYTYMVEKVDANDQYPDSWFVRAFTGTDNQDKSHYTYMGKLNVVKGECFLTAKSGAFKPDSFRLRLLNRILLKVWFDDHSYEDFGFATHHEGRCSKCGRKLTTPLSVERGIGPECWKMIGA